MRGRHTTTIAGAAFWLLLFLWTACWFLLGGYIL